MNSLDLSKYDSLIKQKYSPISTVNYPIIRYPYVSYRIIVPYYLATNSSEEGNQDLVTD